MQRQNEEQGNFRLGVMQTGYRNRDSNMFKGTQQTIKCVPYQVLHILNGC